jgi:hypothetical protein
MLSAYVIQMMIEERFGPAERSDRQEFLKRCVAQASTLTLEQLGLEMQALAFAEGEDASGSGVQIKFAPPPAAKERASHHECTLRGLDLPEGEGNY